MLREALEVIGSEMQPEVSVAAQQLGSVRRQCIERQAVGRPQGFLRKQRPQESQGTEPFPSQTQDQQGGLLEFRELHTAKTRKRKRQLSGVPN